MNNYCCQKLKINGVICHEQGCSDAWKDYILECRNCGSEFKPENENQVCCDESCYCCYYGIPHEPDTIE